MDNDDEVRDRATYFKAILEQHEASLNSQYILNGIQVSELTLILLLGQDIVYMPEPTSFGSKVVLAWLGFWVQFGFN